MPKNSLFHPMDLVFPIGTAALAIGLGVWGSAVADTVAAKWICIGTSLAFLSAIPVIYCMRSAAREHDFVLFPEKGSIGILVKLGEKHRPAKHKIEKWIDETICFWLKHYSGQMIWSSFDGVLLIYADQYKLGAPGMWMRGYATGSAAVVGYKEGDEEYSRSLTIHELSHHVLRHQGLADSIHHRHFDLVELGH